MENRTVNYKEYVINTEEGKEKGLFFRNPLQKVGFDGYYDDSMFSAWKYKKDIKNPIRRLYEILIGNGKIVKNIDEWAENSDFGGFTGNILCFPIYFKRKYRKLVAYSCGNGNIQKIVSYGFESEFNECGGDCDIEKTDILLKNGKHIRIKRKEQYHYTYEHIIKEIIDTEKPE